MLRLLFFLPILLFSAPKQDVVVQAKLLVETFQKKHNIPGLAIGIVYPEEGELKEKILTIGNTDRHSRISIKEETPFRIGRLTETFTATMVVDLAGQGRIKLDDPVDFALPKGIKMPAKGEKKLTLNHLLHHSSSLPKELVGAFNRKEATTATLLNYLTHLHLPHAPGEKVAFSDTDYALLSLVIAHHHHINFNRYMLEEFFPSIGLKETKFELSFHDQQRAAVGHSGLKIEQLLGDKVWSPFSAARGLYSKPSDLMKWLKMQLEGGARIKPLQEVISTADFFGTKQNGMGWEVVPLSNELQLKTFKVSDTYLGYSIYFAFMPTTRMGVFVLSNTDESVDPLGKDLFTLLNRLAL